MLQPKATRYLPFKVDRTLLIAFVVLSAIHISLCKLSASIALEQGIAPIWPSYAVFVAVVLLFGYRLFPAICFAELLTNFILWSSTYKQNAVAIMVLFLASSTVDSLIIPLLYKRWIPQGNFFSRVQNIFKYALIILPSPLLNTTIGVALTCWGEAAPWEVL